MDRRLFLTGLSLAVFAGCARVQPGAPTSAATPASTLAVGSNGTPDGEVMAALLVASLADVGHPAIRVDAPVDVEQLIPAVESGQVQVLPVYAASLLGVLSPSAEPPPVDDVVPALASLLDPGIVVLRPVGVDGRLVYAAAADSGLASLADLRGRAKAAALAGPRWLTAAPDGPAGLAAVYKADFARVVEVVDVSERVAQVRAGESLVGAFRASELPPDSGLVVLADPQVLAVPDPQVVLVSPDVARSERAVLAVDAVQEALTTDELASLAAQVSAGARAAELARVWLAERLPQ